MKIVTAICFVMSTASICHYNQWHPSMSIVIRIDWSLFLIHKWELVVKHPTYVDQPGVTQPCRENWCPAEWYLNIVIVISTLFTLSSWSALGYLLIHMLMIADGVVGSPSMKIGPRILCGMRKLRLVCEIYRSGIIPTKLLFTRQRRWVSCLSIVILITVLAQ